MIATRVPPRPVDPTTYVCTRCGIYRTTKPSRRRPTLCQDCKDVLADLKRIPLEHTGNPRSPCPLPEHADHRRSASHSCCVTEDKESRMSITLIAAPASRPTASALDLPAGPCHSCHMSVPLHRVVFTDGIEFAICAHCLPASRVGLRPSRPSK
ncbi:MAG: hypothetical protein WCG47_16645 [Dermatophilaceae bacterium]